MEIEQMKRQLGYKSRAQQLQSFQRGAESKLDQAMLPQRKALLIKPKQHPEDVRIRRRPVRDMLSNDALRI
jgi:hypothetical protein